MCIGFTDLNKACPKDEFPLPRIDSLVDATASLELMSLLDCYSGYHQIWMKKEDEPKTSFITPSGTYCYFRMPVGLKNAGGSFSRMTAKVLQSSLCTGNIVNTALSRSSTEGAFIVSKNTSKGRGSPCAADLASKFACSFPLLEYFLQKILRKKPPTFGLYPNIFQASNPLPCFFCLHDQR